MNTLIAYITYPPTVPAYLSSCKPTADKKMSFIIAGIATFFSVGAFIFYAVAASGYSTDSKVLKGSQWFYYLTNNGKWDFGLKGFLVSVHDNRHFYDYNDTFESNDILNDAMDKCDSSGRSAIGLTVVACIFSFITISPHPAHTHHCHRNALRTIRTCLLHLS